MRYTVESHQVDIQLRGRLRAAVAQVQSRLAGLNVGIAQGQVGYQGPKRHYDGLYLSW